jgi:hypothetical protein
MKYIEKLLIGHLTHFKYNKYWKMREYVVDPKKKNKIKKMLYLYKIKKSDAFNLCSFGTNINFGASFETPPILPHGPKGIIVNEKCKVGINCVIFHQVTIGNKDGKSPIIGDNVVIYPGAKVIGDVKIGNNVVIGPNSVVISDVADGSIVVGIPGRVIKVQEYQKYKYVNNY